MLNKSNIRQRLKNNEKLIGTFIKLNDPAVVEIIARSGFDFVVIDDEHTIMNRESIVGMIRCADVYGIETVVRVRENNASEILRGLDAGASGVQVPQINTFNDAKAVVDAVKYYPDGNRGFAASQRSAGYGDNIPTEYVRLSNEKTLTVCYCETAQCAENIDDILELEDIDVIFFGPFDLSQSLGVPGDVKNPKVTGLIEEVKNKAIAKGKSVGIIAGNEDACNEYLSQGFSFIALSSDTGMISMSGKKMLSNIKGE